MMFCQTLQWDTTCVGHKLYAKAIKCVSNWNVHVTVSCWYNILSMNSLEIKPCTMFASGCCASSSCSITCICQDSLLFQAGFCLNLVPLFSRPFVWSFWRFIAAFTQLIPLALHEVMLCIYVLSHLDPLFKSFCRFIPIVTVATLIFAFCPLLTRG